MLSLIVNGDDFGKNDVVNGEILKCFRNGILRSTSLMANGKSFDNAVNIVKSNPELDIGVHLTLVEEKPILDAAMVPFLLTDNGYFCRHAVDFCIKYYSGKISLDEVRIELAAQIEKILDHGIKISHLDSHQHVHMLPKILDITIELANHYNIKFIRLPKEKFSGYMFNDLKGLNRIAQMVVLNYFCSKAKEKISYKADYFAGFYFGGKLIKSNLLTLIKYLPNNGICELMCHPGLADDSSEFSHWNYRQVEEMFALIDGDITEILTEKNIETTAFKYLCR